MRKYWDFGLGKKAGNHLHSSRWIEKATEVWIRTLRWMPKQRYMKELTTSWETKRLATRHLSAFGQILRMFSFFQQRQENVQTSCFALTYAWRDLLDERYKSFSQCRDLSIWGLPSTESSSLFQMPKRKRRRNQHNEGRSMSFSFPVVPCFEGESTSNIFCGW